jgi:hypothetical protein
VTEEMCGGQHRNDATEGLSHYGANRLNKTKWRKSADYGAYAVVCQSKIKNPSNKRLTKPTSLEMLPTVIIRLLEMLTNSHPTEPLLSRLLRRASTTPSAVLIALGALCTVDTLHAFRPAFTEPHVWLDVALRALVYVVLWTGLLAGVYAVANIFGRACDPVRRRSYSVTAFAQDAAWVTVLVIGGILSHVYGWFLN